MGCAKNDLGSPLRVAVLENKKVGLRMIIQARKRWSQHQSGSIRIGDWILVGNDYGVECNDWAIMPNVVAKYNIY